MGFVCACVCFLCFFFCLFYPVLVGFLISYLLSKEKEGMELEEREVGESERWGDKP